MWGNGTVSQGRTDVRPTSVYSQQTGRGRTAVRSNNQR